MGKKKAKSDENHNEKRMAIMSEINYEATFFGLWFINLLHLATFLFMSFVVLRFWNTTWYAISLYCLGITMLPLCAVHA